ncbi:SDR family NAD(P)-dependent oxidoreductase [Priestia megaterium]|uniref:SDR family NAD(P)-dependent oxidoreductase n=1 Tax=Priestia megaterium TaxID=1404 RepID=UPI00203B5081|nr:SDR family NAD(P)-dependent oxidoreductase [Priestia megaterium]MCM3194855.1 SDR family NAD(P)-dependent oxidoreductase [Priestia megaterium]
MKLENRTILVTGGTSGIGLAFAKRFVEMGNTVIVTSRSKQNIDQAIKENPNLIGIAADVSQVKSVDQLVHQIKQQYSKLDVLFNSAGIMRYYDLFAEEVTGGQLTTEIDTNLNGTINSLS